MKKLAYHPFLFSIYPVLFLYSHNSEQIKFSSILPDLFTVVATCMILWGVLYYLLKSNNKSSIITSAFVISFFSYGYIPLPDLSRLFIIISLFSLICIYAIKYYNYETKLTQGLNFFSLILILLPFFQISYGFNHKEINTQLENKSKETTYKENVNKPDIYYIVLDGYGREDILKKIFNYDNSNFTNTLKQKGFHVASNSHSNYCHTTLSLASSLNISYHYTIKGLKKYEDTANRLPLMSLIQNSYVANFLKKEGYEIVAFPSGYTYTEMKLADRYIKLDNKYSSNEFTYILLNITPIPYLLDFISNPLIDAHRSRVLSTFNKIPKIEKHNKPIFAFAHIMAPHPPFVFGISPGQYKKRFTYSDGTHLINKHGISREEYIHLYPQQLEYISNKILDTVSELLNKQKNKPIIILQSDHGPGSGLDWNDAYKTNIYERFSILNAVYLPNSTNIQGLGPDITPVNTFRFIFNNYFGENYKTLDNKNFCSNWLKPYKFIDVTNQLN